jgi:hypothetical protein
MSGRYTEDYRQDMRLLRTRPQRVMAIAVTIFFARPAFRTRFELQAPR